MNNTLYRFVEGKNEIPLYDESLFAELETIEQSDVSRETDVFAELEAIEYETQEENGDLWGGLKVMAGQMPSMITDVIPETIGRAIRRGDEDLDESALDMWIEKNKAERARAKTLTPEEREKTWFKVPFTDITVTKGHAEDAADSIGYSIVNAATTFGAKAATAVLLAPILTPIGSMIAATAVGFGAGTAISQGATKDQFVEMVKDEFLNARKGEEMTQGLQDQWSEIYNEIESDADWYGFWEAAPETVGNLLTLGIAKIPIGKMVGPVLNKVKAQVARKIGVQIAKKVGIPVTKFAAMLTEESITEMVTQKKQTDVEFKRGLRDKPLTYAEALEEVLPMVLTTTPVMGGGIAGGAKLAERMVAKKEVVFDDLELIEEGEEPVKEAVSDTFKKIKQDYIDGTLSKKDLKKIKSDLPDTPASEQQRKAIDDILKETPEFVTKATPEDQKRIESFDEMGKKTWDDFQTGKMKIAPETDETKSVQEVADSLKMGKVVFYDAPDSQLNEVNGFFNYKTGEIYVNKNTEKPFLYVASHESLHRLKDQAPDLYKKLIKTLKSKTFKFEEYATALNLKRGLVDFEELTKTELSEEFVADFAARAIATPEFWNKLNAANPTTTRKLAEILIDLINQIRKTLGVKTREYFKDIDAVGELAKTYAEFGKREAVSEAAEAIKKEALPVTPKREEVAEPTPQAEPGIEKKKIEQPAKVENIPAVKLKSGEIISDPEGRIHADIISSKGIDPADVVEGGWIVNGKYQTGASDVVGIGERARAKERVAVKRKARMEEKKAPAKEKPTAKAPAKAEKKEPDIMFSVKDEKLSPLAQEYLDMLTAAQPTIMPTEDTKADPFKGLRKEVAGRMEVNKGLGRPSKLAKIKAAPKSVWHLFTRSFEELDPKEHAGVSNVLRLHKEVRTSSNRRATTLIDQIVDGLKPKQYDIFRMELIMGDMLKDIESGLLTDEKGLPFGFKTAKEVQDYYNEVHKSAEADPVIKDALRRRNTVNNKLKSILVKNGLLPEAVMDDDRYFHHQVMEYRAAESLGNEYALSTGTGTKAISMRKKGWQKARKGSIKEYNTDYIQAEFEVLAQGIAQLETKNTLNRLKGLADMTAALKLQAKAEGIKDWKTLIPEGSVEWTPAPGSAWFRASSLTDRMLMQIQSGEITDPDIIKNVWAKGRDATWIIPQELAKTLDEFGKGDIADTKIDKASRASVNAWKKWILINPYRIIKYNLNNMSGDFDIAFAYDPKIMKYFNQARKDLWAEYRGKKLSKELKGELDLGYRQGVIGSGWVMQDIAGVAQELQFNKKIEALTDSQPGFIKRAWRWSADITTYRENLLRFAAYRYFKDRIAKGEKDIYAASNKEEIDAIKDDTERAAKLSRDLIGDYGNISAGGQWMRRHLIPFYSWLEVNAPRYVRLMRNLKHEDQGAKKGAKITGLVSAKIAWKGAKLAVKATALMAAVMLWNRSVFPDEEDELGEAHRRQMHLILGRRSDGTIITLRFQGALSDALSWFGGEDIASDIKDVVSGKVPISEKAKDAALAPVIKIIHGIRPDVKLPAELLAGESYYPDPFFPRPIRDKWEHIARLFSLNSIQGYLAGKPKRGGTLGGQLLSDIISLGFYTSDPGESAYWNTKKKTFDYLDKLDIEKPRITPTSKANALYYYKRALKYGDLKAAERYLKKYIDLGGTPKGRRLSIKTSGPLGSLTSKHKRKFKLTLTKKDKETLALAEKWYKETYKSQKKEIPWPTEYYLKHKRR